jgi:DNA polymerase III subunit delta
MKPAAFFKHLEQQQILPVYLFTGEAELLMERAWQRLRDLLVPPKAQRFSGESLLAKEVPASAVVERLATMPMFGAKRLVRVKHAEAWLKEQQKTIHAYLAHPNPAACLVLTVAGKKGHEALTAAVQPVGMVVEFAQPSEAELPRWLQEQARHCQKQLSLQAATLLLERVGTELQRLESELEKLCLVVGERQRIEAADIEQTVSQQRAFSVFELLRSVGKCRADQAVSILRRLLLSGEAPLGILALLARQMRILWQVKDALERGSSIDQIGQKLKLSTFVLKKDYLPNIQLFTAVELYQAHRAIQATDVALKSTGLSPESLLESLVLTLCHGQQKGPGTLGPGPQSRSTQQAP